MTTKVKAMFYVYLVLNTVNNKLYVGISVNPELRWKRHKSDAKNSKKIKHAFQLALAKYGVKNFHFKVVDEATDWYSICEKEKQWIKELKDNKFQLYNETDGGEGAFGLKWSDERKQEMSIRNSGSRNPMYGVQRFGPDNPNYGKPIKPHVQTTLLEHRTKLSNEQVEEIKNLYATKNYTQIALSKMFGVSPTQIHRLVNGKRSGTNDNKPITKPNITEQQVIELRNLYATGDYTQNDLAIKYNISQHHVGRIIRKEKWKNI